MDQRSGSAAAAGGSEGSIAELRIERAALDAPVAQVLSASLNAELTDLYPEPGSNHFRLDTEEVAPGRGAFLVAYLASTAVGCGALRLLESGDAEVKRMYADPLHRGLGLDVLCWTPWKEKLDRLVLRDSCLKPGRARRRRSPCTSRQASNGRAPSGSTTTRL